MALGSEINGLVLADFGEPVTITLNGVLVKTVTAVFSVDPVTVSPYESESVNFDANVVLSDADMETITSAHRFEIRGKQYRMHGKPRPDGSGMTAVNLSVQK